MKWFDLKAVDESFFDTAPQRFNYTVDLPVGAQVVWEGLTGEQPLFWCRMLTSGRYTSRRPHGVGTTREVGVAGGLLRLKEEFVVWDDAARRHAFHVVAMNAPLFESFAEYYEVEPTDAGCRLTWIFAVSPHRRLAPAAGATKPVNKLLFDSFLSDTKRHFGKVTKY